MEKKVKWMESDKYFMPKGEVYLATFPSYFSKKYFEVRNILNMRIYTAGESKITYRVISHWDKVGLLPHGLKDNDGWRKFTLVEMVWLKAIQRFREYGFSLDKIARVKKSVFDWNKKLNSYATFEYYVSRAWMTQDDPYIVALANGVAGIASSEEIEQARILHRKNNDMLMISIKSILNELGNEVVPQKPLEWLTHSESQAVKIIREGGDVNIKAKGSKIAEIESSKIHSEHPSVRHIDKLARKEGLFGDVSIRYEKGVKQSAKVTKRTRF